MAISAPVHESRQKQGCEGDEAKEEVTPWTNILIITISLPSYVTPQTNVLIVKMSSSSSSVLRDDDDIKGKHPDTNLVMIMIDFW